MYSINKISSVHDIFINKISGTILSQTIRFKVMKKNVLTNIFTLYNIMSKWVKVYFKSKINFKYQYNNYISIFMVLNNNYNNLLKPAFKGSDYMHNSLYSSGNCTNYFNAYILFINNITSDYNSIVVHPKNLHLTSNIYQINSEFKRLLALFINIITIYLTSCYKLFIKLAINSLIN